MGWGDDTLFLWLYNSKIVTDKEESANSYSNFMVKLVYKCSFFVSGFTYS